MADLTVEQIAAQEKIAAEKLIEETKVKEAAELKATNKKEALRELSKELGINAFEPAELKTKFNEFTTWQNDQKTEQEKLQAKVDLLDKEKTDWQSKQLNYETQIEASKQGIAVDNIDDAMKLAGGDPSKLAEVVKKYPVFASKEGITIGVTNLNNTPPGGGTEVDQYMAKNYKNNPYYHPKK